MIPAMGRDRGEQPTPDLFSTDTEAHYLGHRNLQSTARYTALAPDRFKGFWKDQRW
jgi:hypothetical protein